MIFLQKDFLSKFLFKKLIGGRTNDVMFPSEIRSIT